VFAFAYPETRGTSSTNDIILEKYADHGTGKSLEQIDEIFGDIQKRDIEFSPDEKEAAEKKGIEVLEAKK
jgi:hypothetical protein